MIKAVMGIGIPGAGKSTILRGLIRSHGFVYVNPDSIRKELTGSEENQNKDPEVWDLASLRAQEALRGGKSIVFDATFARRADRVKFIKRFREAGAELVYGVFCDVPFEIAMKRNLARERNVPEHIMLRIFEKLLATPPLMSEGFDALFVLDEYGKIKT